MNHASEDGGCVPVALWTLTLVLGQDDWRTHFKHTSKALQYSHCPTKIGHKGLSARA